MNVDWNITKLECKAVEGDYVDVVVFAHWECAGVDGQYKARIYGTCSFPAPTSSFTPYADLTKDQVLTWCWNNGVDKAITEDKVISLLNEQSNPPIVAPALPWA